MGSKPFRARRRLDQPDQGDPPLDGGDAPSGALPMIDRALGEFAGRRLVSSADVVDLLLDVRSAISLDAALQDLRDEVGVQ